MSGAARISIDELAPDLAALRSGSFTPRSVIHVAQAAEHALRRTLRDDPTASVELRLQALVPEELSLDGLLAELRRHDRIPMEMAAGMHELAAAAARLEAGGAVEPRDAANALAVADALEAQLSRRPPTATLEDPLRSPEPEVSADDEPTVHAVPPASDSGRWGGLAAGVLGVALLVLLAWLLVGRRGGGAADRADALVDRGRAAAAAALLQARVQAHPDDARAAARLARVYRDAGRPVDALRALRDGLSARPADPRLNEELGAQLLAQGRPRDALRAFGAALRADTASERAWVGLVRALRESGEWAAADRALLQSPEAARVLAGPPPSRPTLQMDIPAPPSAQP